MRTRGLTVCLGALIFFLVAPWLSGQQCLECHKKVTPNIVTDWEVSNHSQNDVDCSVCHGETHKSADDFSLARIPTPEICGQCHE